MTDETAKKGRPRTFVRYQGHEIFGLSFHKTKKAYYAIVQIAEGISKRKYFGKDLKEAVFKFRGWEAQQKGEKTVIQIPFGKTQGSKVVDWSDIHSAPKTMHWSANMGLEVEIDRGDVIELAPELIWEKAREIILNDPIEASKLLRIPQLANLYNLTPPPPPLSLDEIGELYYNKRKKTTKHELIDSRSWWNEFSRIVNVKNIRELTIDHIRNYQDEIYRLQQEGNSNDEIRKPYSPAWVGHRFSKIKTIFANAMKSGKCQDELRKILDYCTIFEMPQKPPTDPRPISKEHFHLMLESFDIKYQAILLLALNCALYPKDFFDLKKTDIDLEKKTLVMYRRKTGILRVGMLWDRTIEAIRKYQESSHNASEYLFVTEIGTPINSQRIQKHWMKIRENLIKTEQLKTTIYFEEIRDGAQTAAIHGGATQEQAKFLMGHKVAGITDNYLKRSPKLAMVPCQAIEEYYFGSSTIDQEDISQEQTSNDQNN